MKVWMPLIAWMLAALAFASTLVYVLLTMELLRVPYWALPALYWVLLLGFIVTATMSFITPSFRSAMSRSVALATALFYAINGGLLLFMAFIGSTQDGWTGSVLLPAAASLV